MTLVERPVVGMTDINESRHVSVLRDRMGEI